jgi:hypothetical protein
VTSTTATPYPDASDDLALMQTWWQTAEEENQRLRAGLAAVIDLIVERSATQRRNVIHPTLGGDETFELAQADRAFWQDVAARASAGGAQ